MRRLATRLGVSTQVVYSRIGGKPEVVRELHDRALVALAARLDEAVSEPGTRAHVHEVAQFYFDHAVEDPVRFELMFGTPVPEFHRDDAAHDVEVECFRRTWVASVRHFLDARVPTREGPMAVRLAWRLWTAAHGITTVHLAGHSSPDDDPAAELHAVVDLLLDAAVS
jgi:AcrR family transcriptional regulator